MHKYHTSVIGNKLRENEEIYNVLSIINSIASFFEEEVYLVGGFARDLVLGILSFDLDLVVKGDIEVIVEELGRKLGRKIDINKHFCTSKVTLDSGISVDIVAARKEFYKKPGALPYIYQGSMIDDINRRDFTINTLLIDFRNINNPTVIDYAKGLEDIAKKKIRILYDRSFIDDPTRILRAIRFAVKLDLSFDNRTLKLMEEAIDSGVIWLISKERFFNEIIKIACEVNYLQIFDKIHQYRLFTYISKDESFYNYGAEVLKLVSENISLIHNYFESDKIDIIAVKLAILLHKLSTEELQLLMSKVSLTKKIKDIIVEVNIHHISTIAKLRDRLTPDEIYTLLNGKCDEVLICYMFISHLNSMVMDQINFYKSISSRIVNYITGKDLLYLGIKEGPIYGLILKLLKKEIINNNIHQKNDQILILKEIIKKLKEGRGIEFIK